MSNVSHADGVLLLDVSQERPLVVDLEVEDAVLVREREAGAVDGGRVADTKGLEIQSVEGRQHGELELERVGGGEGVRLPLVPGILRHGNAIRLRGGQQRRYTVLVMRSNSRHHS